MDADARWSLVISKKAKFMGLPVPNTEDEIWDSSMEPICIRSRALPWLSCTEEENEMWSSRAMSLVLT